MARALAATGLTPTRAYDLARLAEADMSKRREVELDLDRLSEIATEVLGEPDAGRTLSRLRRLQVEPDRLRGNLQFPVCLPQGLTRGIGPALLRDGGRGSAAPEAESNNENKA